MYDEQLFDQWANAYDEDVKRTDEAGTVGYRNRIQILKRYVCLLQCFFNHLIDFNVWCYI